MVISFVRSSPLDVAVERSQPVGSFLLFFKFRFNVKTIVQITALANDRFWFTAHVIRARWTVHLSSPCPHNSGCVNNWLQPYPLIPFSHICPFKKKRYKPIWYRDLYDKRYMGDFYVNNKPIRRGLYPSIVTYIIPINNNYIIYNIFYIYPVQFII